MLCFVEFVSNYKLFGLQELQNYNYKSKYLPSLNDCFVFILVESVLLWFYSFLVDVNVLLIFYNSSSSIEEPHYYK